MISEEERKFMSYWEANRDNHAQFSSKLKRGAPMSIIFSGAIICSLVLVYFLSPDWFTKISQKANASFLPILIALIISVVFFSYFRMHFLWERNEETYQALQQKLNSKKS
jgi:hypothetical protein